MTNSQQDSALTRLRLAREKALQGYGTQQNQIATNYQGGIDQLNQQKQEAANRYKNYLANVNNQYTSGTNLLNQQKAETGNQYKNLRDDVTNEFTNSTNLLNQQKTEALPQYQNSRNQVDVMNAQAARNLAENTANNGNYFGGQNVTGQIALNAQRQGDISNLNLQEQNYLNRVAEQLAQLSREQGTKLGQIGTSEQEQYNDTARRMADLNRENTQTTNEIYGSEQEQYNDISRRMADLDRNKIMQVNDITEKIRMLNAQGVDEENAAIKELEAMRANLLMDMNYKADARDLQIDDTNWNRQMQTNQLAMNAANALSQIANQDRSYNLDKQGQDFSQGMQNKQFNANRADTAWDHLTKSDQISWDRDPNNPQVQAQQLANQLSQLNVDNLPYQQQLQNALTQAQINKSYAPPASASKPQSYSQQKTITNDVQNQNFQVASAVYNQMQPEKVYEELMNEADTIINDIGPENYNKLINATQNRYAQTLSATWGQSSPNDIISSLTNERGQYLPQMGEKNYSDMYEKAMKAIRAIQGM
jgi:CRISPR/Cas system CSM-associated protein Csm2 small subunit